MINEYEKLSGLDHQTKKLHVLGRHRVLPPSSRFAHVHIANGVARFVNEKYVYNLILHFSLIIINSLFLKCAD